MDFEEKNRIITLTISEQIAKKIDQHILVRKNFLNEKNISRHKWAQEAVKEKLNRERDVQSCFFKNKSFNFHLPESLEEKVNERVSFVRRFTNSFSRKKWLIEAFLEKVENERDEVKKHLDKSIDSLSDPI